MGGKRKEKRKERKEEKGKEKKKMEFKSRRCTYLQCKLAI